MKASGAAIVVIVGLALLWLLVNGYGNRMGAAWKVLKGEEG